MKKVTLITLLLLSTVLVGCGKKTAEVATPSPRPTVAPTPTPAETPLPEGERPVVKLSADAKKQKVTLVITNLPKDVKDVDYELVYLSEGSEKGSIGTYYVDKKKKEIVLGSCSSGVCNYDKDIAGGTLTIMYTTESKDILLRYPYTLE